MKKPTLKQLKGMLSDLEAFHLRVINEKLNIDESIVRQDIERMRNRISTYE